MTQLVIEAGRTERQYWRDLWRFRELFYFLAWRDLLVRYKQTFVGVGWSLIRPLLTMLVLTLVFGKLGKMPSGGVPYPLLVLCGMLPWNFFSTAMSESGNSLVTNSALISKIYFPRLVIAVSSVITSFVDFLISSAFLVVLMIWYHQAPPAAVVFLPLFVLLAFGCLPGSRFVGFCTHGAVSRFSFHCSVRGPVRLVHLTRRFSKQSRSRADFGCFTP